MNVKLHGVLGQTFGENFYFCVDSISEAIKALQANTGSFYEFLKEKDREGLCYKVVIGNDISDDGVAADDLQLKRGLFGKTLHIIPMAQGAENLQAILNIIIGIILVVVGIFTGNPWLIVAGAMMIIGGIMQLITKPPKPPAPGRRPTSVTTSSFQFQGPVQIMKQGSPVWLGYGRLKVGSSVLSTSYRSTSYFSEYEAGLKSSQKNFIPKKGDGSYSNPVNWGEKSPSYGNISNPIDSGQQGNTADEKSAPLTPPGGPLIFPSWNAYLSGLSTMFNLKQFGSKLYFVDQDGSKVHDSLSVTSDTPSEKERAIQSWLGLRGFRPADNSIPIYESGSKVKLGGSKVSREGPGASEFTPKYLSVSYSTEIRGGRAEDPARKIPKVKSINLSWSAPSSTTKKIKHYEIDVIPFLQYQYVIAFNKQGCSSAARSIYERTGNKTDESQFFEFDFVQNHLDYAGTFGAAYSSALTPKEFIALPSKTEMGLAFDSTKKYAPITNLNLNLSPLQTTVKSIAGDYHFKTYTTTSNSKKFSIGHGMHRSDMAVSWLNINPTYSKASARRTDIYFYGDNSGMHGAADGIMSKQEPADVASTKFGIDGYAAQGENVYLYPIPATLSSGEPISKQIYRPKKYATLQDSATKESEYNLMNFTFDASGRPLASSEASGEMILEQLAIKDATTGNLNFKVFMDLTFMCAFRVSARFDDDSKSEGIEATEESEWHHFPSPSLEKYSKSITLD